MKFRMRLITITGIYDFSVTNLKSAPSFLKWRCAFYIWAICRG